MYWYSPMASSLAGATLAAVCSLAWSTTSKMWRIPVPTARATSTHTSACANEGTLACHPAAASPALPAAVGSNGCTFPPLNHIHTHTLAYWDRCVWYSVRMRVTPLRRCAKEAELKSDHAAGFMSIFSDCTPGLSLIFSDPTAGIFVVDILYESCGSEVRWKPWIW